MANDVVQFTGDAGSFASDAAIDKPLPCHLLDGLKATAERAPLGARPVVPVHEDCHWGNWLVRDRNVTALLDFERARFGEPADDWFFLGRPGSGGLRRARPALGAAPRRRARLRVAASPPASGPGQRAAALRREGALRLRGHLVRGVRVSWSLSVSPSATIADHLGVQLVRRPGHGSGVEHPGVPRWPSRRASRPREAGESVCARVVACARPAEPGLSAGATTAIRGGPSDLRIAGRRLSARR